MVKFVWCGVLYSVDGFKSSALSTVFMWQQRISSNSALIKWTPAVSNVWAGQMQKIVGCSHCQHSSAANTYSLERPYTSTHWHIELCRLKTVRYSHAVKIHRHSQQFWYAYLKYVTATKSYLLGHTLGTVFQRHNKHDWCELGRRYC